MLSIILFLLKLIGILLAFIVFVILLVLVVPVRYEIYAKMDDNILAKGRFHYLFQIIQCKIEYAEKKSKFRVTVFGFTVYDSTRADEYALKREKKLKKKEEKEKHIHQKEKDKIRRKKSKIKKKEQKKKKKSKNVYIDKAAKKDGNNVALDRKRNDKKVSESDSLSAPNPILKVTKEQDAKKQDTKQQDTTIKQEHDKNQVSKVKVPIKDKDSDKVDTEGVFTKICNIFRKIGKSILEINTKMNELIQKQKSLIELIKAKIHRIEGGIKKMKLFLEDEIHKNSLAHIFGYIKRFGNHIKPRSIKGEIEFGLGDPYETGRILAIVSSFYGLFGKYIRIYPNFEEKVLKGNITLKGRMSIGTFVFIILRVYAYKNNRTLFNNIVKLKEEIYE